MNPANDVGKRPLPQRLRMPLTELHVSPHFAASDLLVLARAYHPSPGRPDLLGAAVNFFLAAREEATGKLVDGAGQLPTYSLRTFCRGLEFAAAAAPTHGTVTAMWDGLEMAFATCLD